MAYQIDRYNNTLLTVVQDGTIDQTTDLKFIGKNYAGYGEIQNENFLFLLENFSGSTPPPKRISGQFWFDTSRSKMKFFDGTKWRTTGGAEVQAAQPSGLTEGDFWWDSANEQLYAWNGSGYILVGPQAAGEGVTQMVSREVFDVEGNTHSVIVGTINGNDTIVISYDDFVINSVDPENAIPGFSKIKAGITVNSADDNGISAQTETDFIFWGTASDSLLLGGRAAGDYVTTTSPTFEETGRFPDSGITIGDGDKIKMYSTTGTSITEGIIENTVDDYITFITKFSGSSYKIASFKHTGLVPNIDNTYDIGTVDLKWRTVYANTLEGIATKANSLRVGTAYQTASTSAVNNSIVSRTSTGEINATKFNGVASSAEYADLAEKYTTEIEHSVGTIMCVCSHPEHDVEPVGGLGSIPVGVVSEKPAYLMNAEIDGQALALKGRVPVRVYGAVTKGDPIYVYENGAGRALKGVMLVGVALESSDEEAEKLVECVLKV